MAPMPYYVAPEQMMKDKADYARKNIARGKDLVAIECAPGILMVAENPSATLHKIGELYDRIAFAAVGKFNEFEYLRKAGIRIADLTGFQYSREDVTAKSLANAYAQYVGSIFTEQMKPLEIELLVAQIGSSPENDEMYRVLYDGSVRDEQGFLAMGGHEDALKQTLREAYQPGLGLGEAVRLGVKALNDADPKRELSRSNLEIAMLDRARPRRTFRRLPAGEVAALLQENA